MLNKYWNRSVKNRKRKFSGRGGHGGGRGRIGSGRVRGGWRNFNSSNNLNKRQELKMYPCGTGPDKHTAMFTTVKEHLIINIQSEFLNGIDIAESMRKGVILDSSK